MTEGAQGGDDDIDWDAPMTSMAVAPAGMLTPRGERSSVPAAEAGRSGGLEAGTSYHGIAEDALALAEAAGSVSGYPRAWHCCHAC